MSTLLPTDRVIESNRKAVNAVRRKVHCFFLRKVKK